MPHSIEYDAWATLEIIDSDFRYHYVLAFVLTSVLLALRQADPKRYTTIWKVVLAIGMLWGGWALWLYVPNGLKWHETYFFIPCLLLAVALAKLRQRLNIWLYFAVLLAMGAGIYSAYSVMAPYRAPDVVMLRTNPWNRPNLTTEMFRWRT